ncbi:Type II secretion system protein G precursor [compost metagenome]
MNRANWASRYKNKYTSGFTIVELLIVIVIIGILAAITIVAYNGIQNRAFNSRVQSDIKNVQKLVENYNAINGSYPSTGGLSTVRTDNNCTGGSKQIDWVPDVTEALPQSNANSGLNGVRGCYMYSSDGSSYIVSAWNGINGGPQNTTMYRRLGFREMSNVNANMYYCNHAGAIGGIIGGVYGTTRDYYKYSYTISNITSCNETPPAGA